MDAAKQLLGLIFQRLDREGCIAPQFIGQFDGVDALPKGKYPPIFYWIDTQQGNNIRLSFNSPLLQTLCEEEGKSAGMVIDQEMIDQAVSAIQSLTTTTFQETMSKIEKLF